MRRAIVSVALCLAFAGCHKAEDALTPDEVIHNASCESLVPKVIDMTKGKDPEILEISLPREMSHDRGQSIDCVGTGEFSNGTGPIEYGAHLSLGGDAILTYKQLGN